MFDYSSESGEIDILIKKFYLNMLFKRFMNLNRNILPLKLEVPESQTPSNFLGSIPKLF